jgi:WD40 repeat protein
VIPFALATLLAVAIDFDPVAPLPAGAVRRIGEDRFRHDDTVYALALSADGATAYTIAGDSAYAWDVGTGRLKWRAGKLRHPHSQAGRIVEAGDKVLVAPHDAPEAVALDRRTGRKLGDATPEMWAKLSPGDPRRYRLEGGEIDFVPRGGKGTFRDLGGVGKAITANAGPGPYTFAVSPDGATVALNFGRRSIALYSPKSGERTGAVKDADDDVQVRPLAFTPDGRELVTACWHGGDEWVDVRPVGGGKPRRLVESYWGRTGSPVSYRARFTPDGKRLAIFDGHTWEVREFATGRIAYALPAHGWHGEFTPDGSRFVAGAGFKQLAVYDAATGAAAGPPALPSGVAKLVWTADGRLVALGERAVVTWDPLTGRRAKWEALPFDLSSEGGSSPPDLSANGDRVAFMLHRHTAAAVLDLSTGKRRPLDGVFHLFATVRLSPDGGTAAVTFPESTTVFDTATGKALRTRPDPMLAARSVTDGRSVVAADGEALTVWRPGNAPDIRSKEREWGDDGGFAILPDGRHAVAGTTLYNPSATTRTNSAPRRGCSPGI